MKLCDLVGVGPWAAASLLCGVIAGTSFGVEPAAEKKPRALPTVDEARGRAEVLHESLHAALQAIHHEYFHEEEKVTIPAVTLSKVFRELARRQQVELRWLVVNAQAMNVDNEPRDDFEKQAAKALAAGAESYEAAEPGRYRRVGMVLLESECLQCHLPQRTSVNERVAGLAITIPIQGAEPGQAASAGE